MRNATALAIGAVGLITLVGWSVVSNGQVRGLITCLHDEGESQQHRTRREQAQLLAREINAAEGRLAEQTRRYQPLSAIASLPPAPEGFDLRFYTDGEGYVFSLKDERDPCHYGIFSDEAGRLYEAAPSVPLIAS